MQEVGGEVAHLRHCKLPDERAFPGLRGRGGKMTNQEIKIKATFKICLYCAATIPECCFFHLSSVFIFNFEHISSFS